jgi:phosphoserine phosphatase RsbX
MRALENHRTASSSIDWGVGTRAFAGETESGDLHVVAEFAGGALVAAIDGLGHGSEAAAAANVAAAVLRAHADEALIDLMPRCHEELRRTRGVALSIAAFDFDGGTMTWLGVGNVEGVLFRAGSAAEPAREAILLRGGVVGYQMPSLRATTLPVWPGDTLIFATDGIRGNFEQESPLGREPRDIADDILRRHGKATDDALVLVVRYLGLPP